MIKILHTADMHLGREFPFLGDKGKEHRNQLLRTFEKIVDLAISENVSLGFGCFPEQALLEESEVLDQVPSQDYKGIFPCFFACLNSLLLDSASNVPIS